mmetsp:Transcript_7056/g.20775  ORF Transcript_7056/g.20775 Transcript_7056/m.20775 type:complete len:227 (-) Transcript_7056:354-1034(-)
MAGNAISSGVLCFLSSSAASSIADWRSLGILLIDERLALNTFTSVDTDLVETRTVIFRGLIFSGSSGCPPLPSASISERPYTSLHSTSSSRKSGRCVSSLRGMWLDWASWVALGRLSWFSCARISCAIASEHQKYAVRVKSCVDTLDEYSSTCSLRALFSEQCSRSAVTSWSFVTYGSTSCIARILDSMEKVCDLGNAFGFCELFCLGAFLLADRSGWSSRFSTES